MKTENNTLFAKFLKLRIHEDFDTMCQDPTRNDKSYSTMLFGVNYNWIMKVVEQIEKLDFYKASVVIQELKCTIYYNGKIITVKNSDDSKIEAIGNACAEFLIWHNQQ